MRDCGGYGGVVPDICGDVGIVGCADALEFAERVAGIERSRKKIRKKDNTEAMSTPGRAEKEWEQKKREKREQNRPPDRARINSDRSL